MPMGVTSVAVMSVDEYKKSSKALQRQQAKDHARFWKNVKSGYRSMVGIFR